MPDSQHVLGLIATLQAAMLRVPPFRRGPHWRLGWRMADEAETLARTGKVDAAVVRLADAHAHAQAALREAGLGGLP